MNDSLTDRRFMNQFICSWPSNTKWHFYEFHLRIWWRTRWMRLPVVYTELKQNESSYASLSPPLAPSSLSPNYHHTTTTVAITTAADAISTNTSTTTAITTTMFPSYFQHSVFYHHGSWDCNSRPTAVWNRKRTDIINRVIQVRTDNQMGIHTDLRLKA